MKKAEHECTNCGTRTRRVLRDYRDTESGLPNVVLHGIEVADCPKCGNSDVIIPRVARIQFAIAQAPARLTGMQLRFLRKHLGLSGEELGRYLHTDRTKVSKWERGEDRIGPASDRLVRLLAAALDRELRSGILRVAEHLPDISDEPGDAWELHVDAKSLSATFSPVPRAA
jgi:DNA-binding transcriptional regulator YiaG